jgi:CRISPR-associated protein Cas8a1/Csx13
MAKKINKGDEAGSLCIALNAPGMTPMLKAGLGGLAASLRAINKKVGQKWQSGVRVPLKNGFATAEETKITIEWPYAELVSTFEFLWGESFQISNGVIYLPGVHSTAFDRCDSLPVRFQNGLKSTFLQHGQTTPKSGGQETVTIGADKETNLTYQPYKSYAHQNRIEDIIDSIRFNRSIKLPGWAYPGAAQKHIAYKETTAEYRPSTAIAAFFSLIGCISLPNEVDNGGFLIIPEPINLIEYAKHLAALMPTSHLDTAPASLGDAVLLAEFCCLINGIDVPYISNIHGALMKPMAWDKKQKYRASLVSTSVKSCNIEIYTILRNKLPPKYIPVKDKKGDIWIRPSYLRAFASDNLVRDKPWYTDFSTYTATNGQKTCYLHIYKRKNNLGLLDFSEKEALIAMTDKLQNTERLLVKAVHEAIKHQLGKISEDHKTLKGDLSKRFEDEMQRIRLSFSSAKTQDQVRKAFADLWSKAGILKTMQNHWEEITAFILNNQKWTLSRDLALIGLASYKGQEKDKLEEEHENTY